MITALPTIAVSTIFLTWSASRRERARRERLLRKRVAYMLWVAANQDDDDSDRDDDEPPDDGPRRRPHRSFERC